MTKKFSLLVFRMVTLFLLMTVVPHFASAQPDPCEDTPCEPDAPIDGGLSLLLAAGVGYGLKKARDERKRKIANLN